MTTAPIQTILAVLCAILSLGLVVSLFRRADLAYIRAYVVVALATSIVMDALYVWLRLDPEHVLRIGPFMAAELVGMLSWLAFSRRYARPEGGQAGSAPGWAMVVAVSVIVGIMVASSDLLTHPVLPEAPLAYRLTIPGFAVQVVILAGIILSLASLETTMVNSVHGQRWKIKFTILGAFSILTAEMFVVSLGLLYHMVDFSLTPVRQTGCIIGVALMLYSTLFRGGETPVVVSKRLARTSVVLFASGVYLLFLGAVSMAISLIGASGNRALLLAVGIMAGIGFLALILSDRIRRRCTRFIQLYFYREKYDYRVQWLSFTKRLTNARSREELFQAVLLGFCETFGTRGAALYLRENEGSRLIPVRAWEIYPDPAPLDIMEALPSEIRAAHPFAVHRDGLKTSETLIQECCSRCKASFVVPFVREEKLDGLIVLTQPIDAKEEYNQEDFDLMEALGSQAYSAILNFRLADLLAQARDMEVVGKVSAFIVHDLKNIMYMLSLMTANAKLYINDPDFQQDMILGLENASSKMHLLITHLRQLPTRDTLKQECTELSQLVLDTFKYTPFEGLEVRGTPATVFVDRTQMQKVILNLVVNAREATANGHPVVVETGMHEQSYFKVIDKGCGMSEQFIGESLFQAFKTTKARGMGIGLYQCKHIVEAHGGHIEVASKPGEGSVFTVCLPLYNAPHVRRNHEPHASHC